jgi:deoxyribodipyrimidine photo-lyase
VEAEARSEEAESSLRTWRQELCWREFYKHVLAHWPHVESGAYRRAFDALEWDNRQDWFQAWCAGQTGYPIVDAAMRQLNETGWMHNRCRMIVASFLTKDLLIDWRWGERYFMQKLVDGDLAANNGGWQWSAGVGTDPRPLRIFNPATQAARYDPEGEYIRRYLPELAGLDTPALLWVGNDPKGSWALQERRRCGYPDPIVDHKVQQQEFKRRYQAVQHGHSKPAQGSLSPPF